MISGPLPGVLGGEMQIRHGATVYFRIFVLFLPVLQMNRLAGSLLVRSGDKENSRNVKCSDVYVGCFV